MARIFVGSVTGGGGGGSTNPTSGFVPVNQFGTFLNALIRSTISFGNGVLVDIDDNAQTIRLNTADASILIDGANGRILTDALNETRLQGAVNIFNHLANPLLRFLSNGASDPALKSNGTTLEIRNGNDSNYLDFKARRIISIDSITSGVNFILSTFGSLGPSADGVFTLLDNAGTSFNRLCLGQANATAPALKKSGSNVQVRLGDDSTFASLSALDLTALGTVNTASAFVVTARSILESLTNGNFTLYNQAKSTFNLLQFGGITASFPALKRNGTTLEVRTADDLNFTPISASTVIVNGSTNGISFIGNIMNLYAGITVGNSIIYGNLNGVSIGKGNTLPVASAQLEIVSTARGFLPPRMTSAQRTAIVSPAIGLMVYQTDVGATEGIWTYKSTGWVQGV